MRNAVVESNEYYRSAEMMRRNLENRKKDKKYKNEMNNFRTNSEILQTAGEHFSCTHLTKDVEGCNTPR